MGRPKAPELRDIRSPVRRALETARELGFLGGIPLETQISHAQSFGACVEEFLGEDLPARRDPVLATEDRPARPNPGPAKFLDLGSGGGLPGLVLADRWLNSEAVLLDSNLRRAAALKQAVETCGWSGRVEVLQSRAETAGRSAARGTFDVVVARSFGAPPVTAECAAPFLQVGGLLVVSEPPAASTARVGCGAVPSDTERWPTDALAVVGLEPVSGWRDQFSFQVLRQTTLCVDRFPRREGVPSKRPIY